MIVRFNDKKCFALLFVSVVILFVNSLCVFASSASASQDADALTMEQIMLFDSDNLKLTRSLYLPDKGSVNSSDIIWTSSDEQHITASGRVIRPKFNENNAHVVLTATIINNGAQVTKSFNFTVLSDDVFYDPKYMSDQEFFGSWNDEKGSLVKGKLDYSYSGMENIGEAVKQGDYNLAKTELLSYYKNRDEKYVLTGSRNTMYADVSVDDFYCIGSTEYYQGEMSVGNNFEFFSASVNPNMISIGKITYSIRAWYNEASYAQIASCNNSNSLLRPQLEIVVNGQKKVFTAEKDVTVRHGIYSNTNYGGEEYLKVGTFGDFLGEETYYSNITFDVSEIASEGQISSATLKLYAKASPAFSGEKRLIIIKEPVTKWDEYTANRFTFPGCVYNFSGLPGKNAWSTINGAQNEYVFQQCRFYAWPVIAIEFRITKNEEYAYKAMRIVEDFILDRGNYKQSGGYYIEDINGLRGGFPRTLDTGWRLENWAKSFDILVKSSYMTPEHLTAFLKSVWDSMYYLTTYDNSTNNWRQQVYEGIFFSTVVFPEFTDVFSGEMFRDKSLKTLENMLFDNTFEDGSYCEASNDYSIGAYGGFFDFKKETNKLGIETSEKYDYLLKENSYYNALLFYPNGDNLKYGDSQSTKLNYGTFKGYCDLTADEHLRYIVSSGIEGVEPEFTTKHWDESKVTVMREDWTADSPYLFTQVRGGGAHSHADDNHISLYAFGRTLLTDAGCFVYSSSNPDSVWGRSSTAHNTVVINDANQMNAGIPGIPGIVYNYVTTDGYDLLSQSSFQNDGYEHRRTITFIKPDLWVVSDAITPDDLNQSNNLKQIWHLMPDASLQISDEDNSIFSNYASGANIIVASADSEATVHVENGLYDNGYNQIVDSKYGYFQKDNAAGKTTFDTVLLPIRDNENVDVEVNKLNSDSSDTILKINLTRNGVTETIYFYFSPEHHNGKFGKYSTDAQMAYVVENGDGDIIDVALYKGKYIKEMQSDNYIVNSEVVHDNFAITVDENIISITDGELNDIKRTSINIGRTISNIFINGQDVPYYTNGFNISSVGLNLEELINKFTQSIDNKVVYNNFQLPTYENMYDSMNLKWESDSSVIEIDENGCIIISNDLNPTEVELIAVLTSGNASFQKKVKVSVDNSPIKAGSYSETGYIAIFGELDSSQSGQMVTVYMTNKITNEIFYINQTIVDQQGRYIFKIKFDGNYDDYYLAVNRAGVKENPRIFVATDINDMVSVYTGLAKNDSIVTATSYVNNLFFREDMMYAMIIAQYGENGELLSSKIEKKLIDNEITTETLNVDIDAKTKTIKCFIWSASDSIIPLTTYNEIVN